MNEIDIDSELKKILDQASQNYKQGNLNNAEILYKKVLDMYPYHVPSLINLGVVFEKRKNFNASIKCYKKAIIENPNNIIANFNLASLHNYFGEYDEAIQLFKRIVKINPNFILAKENLGMIYLRNFDLDKSEKYFLEVLKKDKKMNKIQYMLFFISKIKNIIKLEKKKNFEKAIQESEKLISDDPVKIEPYLYCLKSLIKLKKIKTINHILKIIKILGADHILEKFSKKEGINLKFLGING